MNWLEVIILIVGGFFVGFINTLAGGGSIISLSILMYVIGLPAPVANGTNRVAVLLQTLTATSTFRRQQVLDWRKGLKLGIPAVVGSLIGAYIAVDIKEEIFEKAMVVIMVMMLFFIFYKPELWLKGRQELMEKKVNFTTIVIFFFIGIYGGFIHVGIGYFLLIALVLGSGYDLVKANALKVFIVFLFIPFSLIIFIINQQIDYFYGLVLSIGNIGGAYISSKMSIKKGSEFVRWVIVVVVILTAAQVFGLIDIKESFESLKQHL
jgi:uncharacterized membrane protein YfcA